MFFQRYNQRRQRERIAHQLYVPLVEQARQPAFYAHWGVPDKLEGRYDMIILHAWLLLRRLGRCQSDEAKDLSQAVFDLMFADMDRNLREMGVTDLAVGNRVHRMAEAFYGRVGAYDKAIELSDQEMDDALRRNLYQSGDAPDIEQVQAVISYIRRQDQALTQQADGDLMTGNIRFLPLDDPA